MDARHISSPLRSETTLDCRAAYRAAVGGPGQVPGSKPLPAFGCDEVATFAKALNPASGLSAVLGRCALGSRATADQARRRLNGRGLQKSQVGGIRSTKTTSAPGT